MAAMSSSQFQDQILQQQFNNFNQMAATGQLVFTYTDKRRRALRPRRVNVKFDFQYNAIQISFDREYEEMPAKSFDYIYFKEVSHISWGHWTTFFETCEHPPAEQLCFSVVGNRQTLDVHAEDVDMADMWVKGLRQLTGLSDDECNEMAKRAAEKRIAKEAQAPREAELKAEYIEEGKMNYEADVKADEVGGDAPENEYAAPVNEQEADVIRDWWAEYVDLQQYKDLDELLIANGYSSPEILAEITEDELEMLGVSKAKHRRRIMRCLPLLKKETEPEHKDDEVDAPDLESVSNRTEKMAITIQQRDTDNVFLLECTSQRDIAWLRQSIYEKNDVAQKQIVMVYRDEELSADHKHIDDYKMADGDELIWFARNENGSETSASSSRRSAAGFEKRFEDLCDVVQAMQASIDVLSRNVQVLMGEQKVDRANRFNVQEDGDGQHKEEVRLWMKKTVGLPQYETLFINNGFDDLCAIKQALSMDDLKAIGIKNFKHRQRILRHVRKIKMQQN